MDVPIPEDELLRLSYGQIDDYETCPLKYRYVHVLRVPLLTHHAVVYGHAVHEAVRRHFEARLVGPALHRRRPGGRVPGGVGVGGLPVARARGGAPPRGEDMLRRFHEEEARAPWAPTAVEEEFAFTLDRNRVQGRYDLVIERDGEVAIVDFKTGDVREEKAAQKRAKESLQLDIYALAHLKTKGRLPERVELRFLESGLAAGRRPTPEEAAATGSASARPRRPSGGASFRRSPRGWPVASAPFARSARTPPGAAGRSRSPVAAKPVVCPGTVVSMKRVQVLARRRR